MDSDRVKKLVKDRAGKRGLSSKAASKARLEVALEVKDATGYRFSLASSSANLYRQMDRATTQDVSYRIQYRPLDQCTFVLSCLTYSLQPSHIRTQICNNRINGANRPVR